jgi:hypothetical protein
MAGAARNSAVESTKRNFISAHAEFDRESLLTPREARRIAFPFGFIGSLDLNLASHWFTNRSTTSLDFGEAGTSNQPTGQSKPEAEAERQSNFASPNHDSKCVFFLPKVNLPGTSRSSPGRSHFQIPTAQPQQPAKRITICKLFMRGMCAPFIKKDPSSYEKGSFVQSKMRPNNCGD